MEKAHPQPCVRRGWSREGLCVTGRVINGTVRLRGQRGRGAGDAGDCEPAPRGDRCVWDGSV